MNAMHNYIFVLMYLLSFLRYKCKQVITLLTLIQTSGHRSSAKVGRWAPAERGGACGG